MLGHIYNGGLPMLPTFLKALSGLRGKSKQGEKQLLPQTVKYLLSESSRAY